MASWLAGYTHRIAVTIDSSDTDKVGDDLLWFPVPIIISDDCGIDGVDIASIVFAISATTDSRKIAVTESDGTTEFKVEVEQWTQDGTVADSKGVLWVSKTGWTISSGTDEILYLYYGGQEDNANVAGVGSRPEAWDTSNKVVCHMADPPSGDVKDSTSNEDDFTPSGSMTSGDLVPSIIGDGIEFDGNDDVLTESTGLAWTPTIFSVEWQLYPAAFANFNNHIRAVNGWGAFTFHCRADGGVYVGTDVGTRFTPTELPADTIEVDTQYYLVYTYDGTNGRFYVNGVLATGPTAQTSPTAWGGFQFGIVTSGCTKDITGILDEGRISSVARSAAWIKANYYAQDDNLLTYGAEEIGFIPQVTIF